MKTNKTLLSEIRAALGDYIGSEGCSCCQNCEEHEIAKNKLGKLLKIKNTLMVVGMIFISIEKKDNILIIFNK